MDAVIDIFIVSCFVYLLFVFIKQTRSYFIFYFIFGLFALNVLSIVFNLELTRKFLNPLLTFFFVIFAIVFQKEIRRFFRWLILSRGHLEKRMVNLEESLVSSLATALADMAKKRIGAIVVLSGEYPLDDIIEGGFDLDGEISIPLLLSIFDDSTPGHDGAVLIENGRIKKFGVHLPLAEEFKGFSTMGTRHRASSGITERTDALAIVVSEERGTISIAQNGTLHAVPDKAALEKIINKFMNVEKPKEKTLNRFISNDTLLKVLAVIIAVFLWFIFVYHPYKPV